MKILALEFSSPQRSVAVLNTDAAGRVLVVAESIEHTPRNAMSPLAMIESALRDAGLEREQMECIAIGLGPGSYTGIRAAIALAQGWQIARPTKIAGVSSAECIAYGALAMGIRGRVSVVIDAQRQEFYLAPFELDEQVARASAPLRLAQAADVAAREQAGDILVGPEVTRWCPAGRIIYPAAGIAAKLALIRKAYIAADQIEPIYLRETTFVKAPPPRVLD